MGVGDARNIRTVIILKRTDRHARRRQKDSLYPQNGQTDTHGGDKRTVFILKTDRQTDTHGGDKRTVINSKRTDKHARTGATKMTVIILKTDRQTHGIVNVLVHDKSKNDIIILISKINQ